MKQDKPILQELKELESSLYGSEPGNTYQVPANYFDSLPAYILARAKALEAGTAAEELGHLSVLLAGIPKTMPYTVPAGYFEELEQTPYSSIFTEEQDAGKELEMLSPLLQGLKKENPYSVPTGYFETLNSPAETKEEARVIPMGGKNWLRYAAAAIVIAFVSVSGFFYFSKKATPDTDTASFAWIEKNMKKVSTDDIDQFLQLADETVVTATPAASREEVKNLVKNVSDKEIQDFLNDVGTDETEDEILN